MVNFKKHVRIRYDSKWFEPGYYVYVIRVHHKTKGTFYYAGQTGDRNHVSARSPFYRMNGHFIPYESATDNQMFKGLLNKKLIKPKKDERNRVCLERAVSSGTLIIETDFFLISPIGVADHTSMRKSVEELEKAICYLLNEKGVNLLNSKFSNQGVNHNCSDDVMQRAKKIFGELRIK